MTYPKRLRRGAAIGLILVVAASCTETDTQLFEEIGLTRLFLIDPGLGSQSVTDPDRSLQVAEWQVVSAVLDIGGVSVELAPGGDCEYSDTTLVTPLAEGACAGGLVVESSPDPLQILLTLELGAMQVRRAEPLFLSPAGDFDGDGVVNDGDMSGSAFDKPCGLGGLLFDCDDNCPLISNADQADANSDGIGNACSVFDFFSGFVRDSDGDGVADGSDNCVWIANSDQADTQGPGEDGIPDLIGDACQEQIAQVQVSGNPVIELLLGPDELLQATGAATFITVDFDSRQTLSCDWVSLTCTLDPEQVQFCGVGPLQALGGCP